MRAVAGEFPLDYSSVFVLGKALIALLREKGYSSDVLLGRDTRESGDWLEQALIHGIREAGGSAVSAGIIPTSGVAFLTRAHAYSAGIVISASHNPYEDNGIKVFSSEGMKITSAWEENLEQVIATRPRISRKHHLIQPDDNLAREYRDFLSSRFTALPLPRDYKIVLDCSNGAACRFAPRVFEDLGFEVVSLNAFPNGRNINVQCGSLHPQNLARKVVETKADIGVAYDGDADRALWVDETGRILNGDHTLYVLSRFMRARGRLKSDTVVATTMSNFGLEKALARMELKLHRAPVGDRYVLEQMLQLKTNFGGEQSGHTIFLDDCPTGDGILTSLKMVEAMVVERTPLSALVADYEQLPQVLLSVPVARKEEFQNYPEIAEAIKTVEGELAGRGRMNVRYSGTEPLARIMIEGESQAQVEQWAQHIAETISRLLGT